MTAREPYGDQAQVGRLICYFAQLAQLGENAGLLHYIGWFIARNGPIREEVSPPIDASVAAPLRRMRSDSDDARGRYSSFAVEALLYYSGVQSLEELEDRSRPGDGAPDIIRDEFIERLAPKRTRSKPPKIVPAEETR